MILKSMYHKTYLIDYFKNMVYKLNIKNMKKKNKFYLIDGYVIVEMM